jgi:hypothetical protein
MAWVTQHPPMHHPKNPVWDFMDGMKLSPRGQFTWSVFYFSSRPFFFQPNFYSLSQFSFFGGPFLFHLFLAHPWIKVCIGKLLPTPNLPTALLPTNPPPSLMLPTPPHPTICTHFQHPLVLFLPSPSPNKWAPPSQEVLRKRAIGA